MHAIEAATKQAQEQIPEVVTQHLLDVNATITEFAKTFQKSYPGHSLAIIWTAATGPQAPSWTFRHGPLSPIMHGYLNSIEQSAEEMIGQGIPRQTVVANLSAVFDEVVRFITTGERK